jgi:hypothetical protein
VSSIDVEVDGHIGLRPAFLSAMRSDAFSQLHQESMIAAGHALIFGVLFSRCVWHARHRKNASNDPDGELLGNGWW